MKKGSRNSPHLKKGSDLLTYGIFAWKFIDSVGEVVEVIYGYFTVIPLGMLLSLTRLYRCKLRSQLLLIELRSE